MSMMGVVRNGAQFMLGGHDLRAKSSDAVTQVNWLTLQVDRLLLTCS